MRPAPVPELRIALVALFCVSGALSVGSLFTDSATLDMAVPLIAGCAFIAFFVHELRGAERSWQRDANRVGLAAGVVLVATAVVGIIDRSV